MEQACNRLILVAVMFDHQSRDCHQVRDVGDGRSLARLIAVQPVGKAEGFVESVCQQSNVSF
jgi:hypothetical protein